MKKPSAELSPGNITDMNKEHEEQNEQLNKCVVSCVALLQKQEMVNMQCLKSSEGLELTSSKERMHAIHKEEIERLTDAIVEQIKVVKQIQINKKDVKYSDEKINALDNSHDLIKDSKDMVKGMNQICGKAATDAASSAPK